MSRSRGSYSGNRNPCPTDRSLARVGPLRGAGAPRPTEMLLARLGRAAPAARKGPPLQTSCGPPRIALSISRAGPIFTASNATDEDSARSTSRSVSGSTIEM